MNNLFRLHPEATKEIRESVRWYRDRNLSAAADFRIAVSDGIRSVAHDPQRWPKYLHGTRRMILSRFPFSVVYIDDPPEVTIIAVAHPKRRPGYWKQRM